MSTDKITSNHSYIIHGWMQKQLGLKGNELLVYSIISHYSQLSDHSYHGSLSYLAEWCGMLDKRNVIPVLDRLIQKGVISKEEVFNNGIKFCHYKALYYEECENHNGGVKITTGDCENHNGGGVKFTTKYKSNNNKDNNKDNITPLPPYEDVYFNDDRDEAIKKWLEYRKQIKKPLKPPSIKSLVNSIEKSNLTASELNACIDKSISNGWQGLFLDKDKKKPRYDWANL